MGKLIAIVAVAGLVAGGGTYGLVSYSDALDSPVAGVSCCANPCPACDPTCDGCPLCEVGCGACCENDSPAAKAAECCPTGACCPDGPCCVSAAKTASCCPGGACCPDGPCCTAGKAAK